MVEIYFHNLRNVGVDFNPHNGSRHKIHKKIPRENTLLYSTGCENYLTISCTSVDPVKEILLTSGWDDSAAPAVGPYPGTTFTTPGGNPAFKLRTLTRCKIINEKQLVLLVTCKHSDL